MQYLPGFFRQFLLHLPFSNPARLTPQQPTPVYTTGCWSSALPFAVKTHPVLLPVLSFIRFCAAPSSKSRHLKTLFCLHSSMVKYTDSVPSGEGDPQDQCKGKGGTITPCSQLVCAAIEL